SEAQELTGSLRSTRRSHEKKLPVQELQEQRGAAIRAEQTNREALPPGIIWHTGFHWLGICTVALAAPESYRRPHRRLRWVFSNRNHWRLHHYEEHLRGPVRGNRRGSIKRRGRIR